MNKLPVRIDYTFDIDLNITENLIPFVKISLLIDNIPEEEIHFYSHSEDEKIVDTYFYWDAWYVYGDGDLLYVGRRTDGNIIAANLWRGKYLYPVDENGGTVNWLDREEYIPNPAHSIVWNFFYKLHWKLSGDDYRIVTPYGEDSEWEVGEGGYVFMPYSTITVKRNTGENLTTIKNINPDYEVPDWFNAPDLEQHRRDNILNQVNNMKKVWIKISDNKYKLKIWGSIGKLTSSEISDIGNYEIWNCTYVPYYYKFKNIHDRWIYRSGYKLSSQSIVSMKKDLYKGQATPNNLRLLVSYLNNKGYHETRKYKA